MTAGENQAGGGAGEAVRGFGWGQGRVGGGGEAAQEGERMNRPGFAGDGFV